MSKEVLKSVIFLPLRGYDLSGAFYFAKVLVNRTRYQTNYSIGTISSATMLIILINGLIAGPAVSL